MNKGKLTVGAQFKNSLQVLIEKMNQANPHFVRCIKPNHSKVITRIYTDITNVILIPDELKIPAFNGIYEYKKIIGQKLF